MVKEFFSYYQIHQICMRPKEQPKAHFLLFLPIDRHYKSRFTSPYTTCPKFKPLVSRYLRSLGVMATGRWNTSPAGWPQTGGLKLGLLLKTRAVIWTKKQAITSLSLDPQPKGKDASQRWEAEGHLVGKPFQDSGGRLVPRCSSWWGTVLWGTSSKAGCTRSNLRISPWFSPNLTAHAQSMERHWKSNHPHNPRVGQHTPKLPWQ